MEEVFKGLTTELVIANVSYGVEQAFIDKEKHLFIIPSLSADLKAMDGMVVVKDDSHLYATLKVKIVDSKPENDKVMVVCEPDTKGFDVFKRSFVRLNTDIPVEYTLLKPDTVQGQEELVPISLRYKGTLVDINVCGACVEVKDAEVVLEDTKTPIYMSLSFKIEDEIGREELLSITGKVVNIKKGDKKISVGILFVLKSFREYRLIEHYYLEKLKSITKDSDYAIFEKQFLDATKTKFIK